MRARKGRQGLGWPTVGLGGSSSAPRAGLGLAQGRAQSRACPVVRPKQGLGSPREGLSGVPVGVGMQGRLSVTSTRLRRCHCRLLE